MIVIFIKVIKLKTIYLILALLILLIAGIVFVGYHLKSTSVSVSKPSELPLESQLKEIFDVRNNALLEGDVAFLENLYDRDTRNGQWAYEHELKKMNYIDQWSDKQGITFHTINSYMVVNSIKEGDKGFTANLAVSTEYIYSYDDEPSKENSFRIGTYHSLDLVPNGDDLMIIREWYNDPFADSLDVDEHDSQEVTDIILSGEEKDLSDLNIGRLGALKYADEYCGVARPPDYSFQYNTQYKNFNSTGGDCTNFASQVLYEGGNFSKDGAWNYENGSGTKAWVNANSFNDYMLYSGRTSLLASGSYEEVLEASYNLLPGDYIAYGRNGKANHISVVTGIDSKGYTLVNSHNADRYRVPWDLGWGNQDVKFWLVNVHY